MDKPSSLATNRRAFLGGAATAVVSAGLAPLAEAAPQADVLAGVPLALTPRSRADAALLVRAQAAAWQRLQAPQAQRDNGDEARYPKRLGSYSKGLPHNALGEVNLAAYESLRTALRSGRPEDFERITLGGGARLTNPQAGLAFALEGPDAAAFAQQPAPAFASAEEASEIAENYWMALTRDVSFLDYDSDALVAAAAADLSAMSDFRGPKVAGQVTPATLFRAGLQGDLVGPYLSQFLWLDTPFGAEQIDRRMRCPLPGDDHMTDYAEWLAIQNGAAPGASTRFDSQRRYIRNGRDLAEWVHIDVLFQAYFNALLILFDLHAPFAASNPYHGSATQNPFGTFGPPYMASALCGIAREALKAVWHQKWFVHRRLRPEAFAGRVHNHKTGAASYPVHADILGSAALTEVHAQHGSYLLPMAFPEGCPTHPAYGAGHATVAGACVTLLKAFFDESFEIPAPVVPSADGLALVPYSGPALTVGHELDKLAANVAFGRNIAGVHWRSDGFESLKLGENLALRYLADERRVFNERLGGFTLRRFDGTLVTV